MIKLLDYLIYCLSHTSYQCLSWHQSLLIIKYELHLTGNGDVLTLQNVNTKHGLIYFCNIYEVKKIMVLKFCYQANKRQLEMGRLFCGRSVTESTLLP